jgi:hypothetical protein
MPDAIPTPDIFDELAAKLTEAALANIDQEFEAHTRLPLIFQSRAIVAGVIAHTLRHSFHCLAEWTMEGVDVRGAFIPGKPGIKERRQLRPPGQPPQEPPPSPL